MSGDFDPGQELKRGRSWKAEQKILRSKEYMKVQVRGGGKNASNPQG